MLRICRFLWYTIQDLLGCHSVIGCPHPSMGWADSLFFPLRSADANGLWSGSAGMPSERWYPYPSARWGDSLFSPLESSDACGLLIRLCQFEMVSLPIRGMGRIYGGRKHTSFENAYLQSSSFQESIQKGQIFIKFSGVVLDYTY